MTEDFELESRRQLERFNQVEVEPVEPVEPEYRVDNNDDEGYIAISRDGEEVLYWDENEWLEDPQVCHQIVEACLLAYTCPREMDRRLKEMGKI